MGLIGTLGNDNLLFGFGHAVSLRKVWALRTYPSARKLCLFVVLCWCIGCGLCQDVTDDGYDAFYGMSLMSNI
jgi:hypothetical protein